MEEHTRELLDMLTADVANWEKAAEDMEFVAPLLHDDTNHRSALARAAWYRSYAARRRVVLERIRNEVMEETEISR
ncbi:MAG: hypothetical protein ACR2IF_06165 [Terriglobales bacterium]